TTLLYTMSRPKLHVLLFLTVFFACKERKTTNNGHTYTNALIHETSPYLLQHAHNPVNWKPWGKEALDEAKKDKKLILVSIGYSSCHWCHVMEEETFENEEVAKIMNDNFINIKVDREERPDVDHIYQIAAQLFKENGGGWPLNVITLPDGKPIYGDTYHTTEDWVEVLKKIGALYNNDPEKARAYSEMVANGIQEVNLIQPSTGPEELTRNILLESVKKWKAGWDIQWGGENEEEKFIIPSKMEFLLDYALLTKDTSAKSYVKTTLDKAAMGGIYDHIGGGFFRYSTDPYWKVPHFEKMLYDNAQMLSLYSKGYNVFKKPLYKKIVMETFAFIEREMSNSKGGYYAAIDADSEGEEGGFYLWKEEELRLLLKKDFQLFSEYFNITPEHILENEKFVLYHTLDDDVFMKQNSISKDDLEAYKTKWKKLLLDHRRQRTPPNTDDKIITSWNALLINGLLEAYKSFGENVFLERAEAIFEFISAKSLKKDKLIHVYKKGNRNLDGFSEDYALMVSAALTLYSTTLNDRYLNFAQSLNEKAMNRFEDKASGMYKYREGNELISKIIKTADGFWPSPNAVMAHNLFKLGHIQYNKEFLEKSKNMLSSMIPSVKEYPQNYSEWNTLFLNTAYPYYEIAVVGENALPLVKELNKKYIPNILLVGSLVESGLPLFKGRYVDESTYIYVCQNGTCKLPVETIEEVTAQLESF
ncbi:MAG: thioredoxin domain-containing protein, partial [Bacteroidota bacterium]